MTHTMVISTLQKIAYSVVKYLSIKCRDFQLKSVLISRRYLGIENDNRLPWSPQIRMTIKKVNIRLSILSNKKVLPFRLVDLLSCLCSLLFKLRQFSLGWGSFRRYQPLSTIQKRCSKIFLDIQNSS